MGVISQTVSSTVAVTSPVGACAAAGAVPQVLPGCFPPRPPVLVMQQQQLSQQPLSKVG